MPLNIKSESNSLFDSAAAMHPRALIIASLYFIRSFTPEAIVGARCKNYLNFAFQLQFLGLGNAGMVGSYLVHTCVVWKFGLWSTGLRLTGAASQVWLYCSERL